MEYKDKVRWLNRYQDSLRQEKVLILEIEALEAQAERVTQAITGMPGKSSVGYSEIPFCVEHLLEKRDELKRIIAEEKHIRNEIEYAIRSLSNDKARQVLELHYILGQSYTEIAYTLGLDERWIRRISQKGVNCIETDLL